VPKLYLEMLAKQVPCPEMLRLMLEYTEAALAHCNLTRGYGDAQGKPETGVRIGRARIVRDTAWLAWEKHVSGHGYEWAQAVTL
jgi:hypothetical protein